MAELSTIFWDGGGVIFSEADLTTGAEFKPIIGLLGITPEVADEVFNQFWPKGIRLGNIPEDQYWQALAERSTRKLEVEEVKDLYRSCITINERLLELVRALSPRLGHYLLSNQGKEWMDYMAERWALKEYFQDIFCSADLKVAKPDRAFFDIALSTANVKPSRVVYVDNQENNIRVGEELGLKTVLFKNNRQLGRDLSRILGVNIDIM